MRKRILIIVVVTSVAAFIIAVTGYFADFGLRMGSNGMNRQSSLTVITWTGQLRIRIVTTEYSQPLAILPPGIHRIYAYPSWTAHPLHGYRIFWSFNAQHGHANKTTFWDLGIPLWFVSIICLLASTFSFRQWWIRSRIDERGFPLTGPPDEVTAAAVTVNR